MLNTLRYKSLLVSVMSLTIENTSLFIKSNFCIKFIVSYPSLCSYLRGIFSEQPAAKFTLKKSRVRRCTFPKDMTNDGRKQFQAHRTSALKI